MLAEVAVPDQRSALVKMRKKARASRIFLNRQSN